MISIRPLTHSDIAALFQLQCSCYPPSLWDTEDELRALVFDPANLALGAFETVAVANIGARLGLWKNSEVESLVGTVLVKAPDGRHLDRPELYSIEVSPASQHRGVGRKLLKEALKQMPGRMVAHCTAEGKRLIERSGRFKRTGDTVSRSGVILETFVTKDPAEESEGSNRMLTILLVIAAAIAVLYLMLGRETAPDAPPPAPPPSLDVLARQREDAAKMAREWATQLEMKVTGVSCSAEGLCTIARDPGLPFTVRCLAGTCVVEVCPR